MLLIAFPLLALVNYIQILILAGTVHNNKKRMENSGQIVVESVDNIHTVASLGLEPYFCLKYNRIIKDPFRYSAKT